MNVYLKKLSFLLLFTLFPLMSFAHISPEHGDILGFNEGFFHPFSGVDHLFAMLLVGIWSAMNTKKWFIAPISFASLLLLGAVIGMQGIEIAATEYIVSASLLVIGIMVAMKLHLNAMMGAVIVGFFALFHGFAHGNELSHSINALLGMVLATAILHIIGLLIGYFLIKQSSSNMPARFIGIISSLLGIGLLAGMI